MRQRMVPSRPATGREVRNSGQKVERPRIARRSVTVWRALNRFASFSPDPFASRRSARDADLREELLHDLDPVAHDPGAPRLSAPSDFRICSATKLFEVLLSL